MENSAISWCDHTFNPWEGCTKVSPGCAHCYAETRNARFDGGTAPNWGKGAPRRRTSVQNWNAPRRWNKEAGTAMRCDLCHNTRQAPTGTAYNMPGGACWYCYGWEKKRPRVFCASLADWLDDEVLIEWLADLLALIHQTPNLDWLLLTKRPQNWAPRLNAVVAWAMARDIHIAPVMQWLTGKPPSNVWLGTTVEDQQRANERIPVLLKIPARVRFLSCEPLLGPVNLTAIINDGLERDALRVDDASMGEPERHVDWVICGGESGPGARPMHPDWARSLRDQCATAGVPFHFKQWGEWLPEFICGTEVRLADLAANQMVALGDGKTNHVRYTRVGKKAAGRLLYGVTHDAFPSP